MAWTQGCLRMFQAHLESILLISHLPPTVYRLKRHDYIYVTLGLKASTRTAATIDSWMRKSPRDGNRGRRSRKTRRAKSLSIQSPSGRLSEAFVALWAEGRRRCLGLCSAWRVTRVSIGWSPESRRSESVSRLQMALMQAAEGKLKAAALYEVPRVLKAPT